MSRESSPPPPAGGGRPLNESEVEALQRDTSDDLIMWFYGKVGDPELAADLFGETWNRAARGLPDFRPSGEDDARRWLWRIAAHVLSNYGVRIKRERRMLKRLAPGRLAVTDEDIEKINDRAARDQLSEAVAVRMAELPQAQREAVRLHVIEELPYEQVAERIHTTPEAARVRVSRALRRLGVELEPDYREWQEGNP